MAIQNIDMLFTKPHPHAELMLQYAKDAMETDKPWEMWEWKEPSCTTWGELIFHPQWVPELKYRRKPKPYEPTLLDEALELEIEAAHKRTIHYAERHGSMHSFTMNYGKLRDILKKQRTPKMIEHLKAQGKL